MYKLSNTPFGRLSINIVSMSFLIKAHMFFSIFFYLLNYSHCCIKF